MISAARLGVLGVLVAALVSCSSAGDHTGEGTEAIATTDSVDPVAATSAPVTASAITPPSTVQGSVATVPDGGVPGLDSDDAFCRGWSEFAGTFQALALASVAGSEPPDAARSEVLAAGALLAAVDSIATAFPEAIAVERSPFVEGLLGPLTRRAGRARDELLTAGLSQSDVDELGTRWLDALAVGGLDDPELTVDVPVELRSAVDEATAVFADEVPSIVDDPSLVTDAAAPGTLAYIAANCPDQGTLGGYDVID